MDDLNSSSNHNGSVVRLRESQSILSKIQPMVESKMNKLNPCLRLDSLEYDEKPIIIKSLYSNKNIDNLATNTPIFSNLELRETTNALPQIKIKNLSLAL